MIERALQALQVRLEPDERFDGKHENDCSAHRHFYGRSRESSFRRVERASPRYYPSSFAAGVVDERLYLLDVIVLDPYQQGSVAFS